MCVIHFVLKCFHAGCLYECSARLSATELTITCTVNGQDDSESTISYEINDGDSVNGKIEHLQCFYSSQLL